MTRMRASVRIQTRGGATALLGALVYPAAVVASMEALVSYASAGPDRPWLVLPASLSVLVQTGAAIVIGFVIVPLLPALRGGAGYAAAPALALGTTAALTTLTLLANGALPLFPPRALAPLAAFAIAAGVGAAAGLLRRLLLRPSHAALAVALEAPLVAGALLAVYSYLPKGWPPTSKRGLAVLGAAAGLALLVALLGEWIAGEGTSFAEEPAVGSAAPPMPDIYDDRHPPAAPEEGHLGFFFRARRRPRRAASGLWASRLARAALVLVPALALAASGVAAVVAPRPYPVPPPRGDGPPDVLLIVLDTTRADAVPAPAGSRAPTPALARLARSGTLFTHAFSTSCWTLPAHASLFSGLAPSEHGAVWETSVLPTGSATIAERFTRAGWRTAGFSANPWISPDLGFDRGFEQFTSGADRRPRRLWLYELVPWPFAEFEPAAILEDKGGVSLVSALLAWLGASPLDAAPAALDAAAPAAGKGTPDAQASGPRPSFAFLNLMESHLEYAPPRRALGSLAGTGWNERTLATLDQDGYRDLKPGKERTAKEIEGLRLLYEAEVAWNDHLVGRLLDALEAAGRLEKTVIVVTSDHGENLGQHPPLDHQLGLWDTLIRVPLIVAYPRRFGANRVVDDLVSIVDLPGALLELAGARDKAVPAAPPKPAGEGGVPLIEGTGRDLSLSTVRPAEGRTSKPDARVTPGGPILGGGTREAVFFEYERPTRPLEIIRASLGLDPKPWDRTLAGIRTHDLKWIRASDGRHLAFDLGADPGETKNLASRSASPPAAFAPLDRSLEAARAARMPAPGKVAPKPLSDEMEERLRSLGYIR